MLYVFKFKLHYMLFPPSGYIPHPCIQSPEKSLAARHIDFRAYSSYHIHIIFIAPYLCRPRSAFHSAFTTLPPSLWRQCPHCRIRSVTTFSFSRLGSTAATPNVVSQKLLLHCRLELMSESPESGALSLIRRAVFMSSS